MTRTASVDRYHDELSKLAYFLQGVSASAIAFALHETADRQPGQSLLVIGAAVLIWGFAFAAGVMFWHSAQIAMKANVGLELLASHQAHSQRAELTEQFDKYNARAGRWYRCLSWGLLIGALVYSFGHVLHIYEHVPIRRVAARSISPLSSRSGDIGSAATLHSAAPVPIPSPLPSR